MVTAIMLSAARTLGYPILLYDGSFEEWGADPERPVVPPS
jgi:3-mercaptopyruvate sulfurtransferase SseA